MKGKAITIDGHLVRLSDEGIFFRLNGNGKWAEISTKQLYALIDGDNEITKYAKKRFKL